MNELYIVRHGDAVPHGTPDIPDDERPLTPDGVKRMKKVARGLKRLDVAVDRILTSPLPRARRTAEIVAEALGQEADLEDCDALRADRNAQAIRAWLQNRPEERLMIVGHNPALSDLVGLLTAGTDSGPFVDLKKGGVALLTDDPAGRLQVEWILTPKLLKQID